MKVVYSEKEVEKLLIEHLQSFTPEGKVAHIEFNKYASDYCVIIFSDKPKEESGIKTPDSIDDKPIDLSEIPF